VEGKKPGLMLIFRKLLERCLKIVVEISLDLMVIAGIFIFLCGVRMWCEPLAVMLGGLILVAVALILNRESEKNAE